MKLPAAPVQLNGFVAGPESSQRSQILTGAGRPGWWLLLFLIPLGNLIIAKSFGNGMGFGLAFLGFIFYPILGFGSATYQGPSVKS